MAGDRHVVWLVSQDEAGQFVPLRQLTQRLSFGRAAAEEAVRTELKRIAAAL